MQDCSGFYAKTLPPQKNLRHFQKFCLLVSAVSRGRSDLEPLHRIFGPPLRAHILSEHLFWPQRCLLPMGGTAIYGLYRYVPL